MASHDSFYPERQPRDASDPTTVRIAHFTLGGIRAIFGVTQGPIGFTLKGLRDCGSDRVRCPPQRVYVRMGIALRCRGVCVSEQLADDRQAHASPGADAGEGMPQVVNSDPPPIPRESTPISRGVADRPWVFVNLRMQ